MAGVLGEAPGFSALVMMMVVPGLGAVYGMVESGW